MQLAEVFALAGAIVVLATVTVLIINGGKTAAIITSSGNVFVNAIKAATQQGK